MKNNIIKFALTFALPLITGILSVSSPKWLILTVISVFVTVGIAPWCNKYENVWISLLIFVSMMPINLHILRIEAGVEDFAITIVFLSILFTIEEMLALSIGRWLWKEQKSIEIIPDNLEQTDSE